jgi:hypothetical protein
MKGCGRVYIKEGLSLSCSTFPRAAAAGAESSVRRDLATCNLDRPLVTNSSLSLTYFPTFLHATKVDSKTGSFKLNVIIVLVLRQKSSGNYYS